MREIKFRAWDNFNNKIYSHMELLASNSYNDALNGHPQLMLMQYTGLKDKNGQEIYEGDIARGDNDSLLQVVWSDNHQWGCKVIKGGVLSKDLIFPLWHWDRCERNKFNQLEVIGNICENPELLNG